MLPTWAVLLIKSFSYSSNPFAYVALIGVADAVAILIGTPACSYLGRKTTVGGSIIIAAVLTFLVMAVPEGNIMTYILWKLEV